MLSAIVIGLIARAIDPAQLAAALRNVDWSWIGVALVLTLASTGSALAAVARLVVDRTATAGMIACCAHHLADLLPFVGLAGAATFLYDYRLAVIPPNSTLVLAGLSGIGLGALHRRPFHGQAVDEQRHLRGLGAGGRDFDDRRAAPQGVEHQILREAVLLALDLIRRDGHHLLLGHGAAGFGHLLPVDAARRA